MGIKNFWDRITKMCSGLQYFPPGPDGNKPPSNFDEDDMKELFGGALTTPYVVQCVLLQ